MLYRLKPIQSGAPKRRSRPGFGFGPFAKVPYAACIRFRKVMQVTLTLPCEHATEEILLPGDNKLNIEAAAKVGMKAVQAQGVAASEQALREA